MSIISAKSISKRFIISEKNPGLLGSINHIFFRKTKTIEAVKNISFDINKGEVVGFLGSNGAGKTTILKMLCGLIHPSQGQLHVAGYEPKRRKNRFLSEITLVIGQKQQLIWDLPPLDSIKVNAAVYGISKKELDKRIDELANMLELDKELTRPVRKLSLGQRMKAELMASLLHKPSILFLDEPTLGLDINAQVRVRQFLVDYNKKYGATILLTSHYMEDILSLCQRVLLIHEGSLFFDGDLSTLIEKISPGRLLNIQLSLPCRTFNLSQFGEVLKEDEFSASILVDKTTLPDNLSLILRSLPIKDLEVRQPPIEKLLGNLLSKGAI